MAKLRTELAKFEKLSRKARQTEAREGEGDLPGPAEELPSEEEDAELGWGGPWRAYVARETFGTKGRPDLAALARAYRCLSAEDRAELVREGEEAHERRRCGGLAFGGHTRDLERESARTRAANAVAAVAERSASQLEIVEAEVSRELAVCHTGGLEGLRHLRAASAEGNRRRREADASMDRMLQDYEEGDDGVAARQAALEIAPRLKEFAGDWVPEPGETVREGPVVHKYDNTDEHKWDYWPSQAERRAKRGEIMSAPEWAALLARERPLRIDEPDEPDDIV